MTPFNSLNSLNSLSALNSFNLHGPLSPSNNRHFQGGNL